MYLLNPIFRQGNDSKNFEKEILQDRHCRT